MAIDIRRDVPDLTPAQATYALELVAELLASGNRLTETGLAIFIDTARALR